MPRVCTSREYAEQLRDAPKAVRGAVRAIHDLPPHCKNGEPVDCAGTHVFIPAPDARPDPATGLFGIVLFTGRFADLAALRQGIRDKFQDPLRMSEAEHIAVGPVGTFLPIAACGEALQCDQLFCPQDRTEEAKEKAKSRKERQRKGNEGDEPNLFDDDGTTIRPDVLRWKKDKHDNRSQKQKDREDYAQRLGVLDAIELELEPAYEFLQEAEAETSEDEIREALRYLEGVQQRRVAIDNALTANSERLKEAEEGVHRYAERIAKLDADNPGYRAEWLAVYREALAQTGQHIPCVDDVSEFNPMKYLAMPDE